MKETNKENKFKDIINEAYKRNNYYSFSFVQNNYLCKIFTFY